MEKINSYREFVFTIHSTKNTAEVQLALRELIDKNSKKHWKQLENIQFLERIEKEIYRETEEELSIQGMTNIQHALELINDYKSILSKSLTAEVNA